VQKLGLKWGKPEDADISFDPFNLILSVS